MFSNWKTCSVSLKEKKKIYIYIYLYIFFFLNYMLSLHSFVNIIMEAPRKELHYFDKVKPEKAEQQQAGSTRSFQ